MPPRRLVVIMLAAVGCSLSAAPPRDFNFENDIVPILSRFGCNTSGCHGKAEGQNGFKLSVFGFSPESDYRAIVMEGRGRRVFPGSPDRSLLLQKAGGGMPHGGGVRIPPDRREFQLLRDWIAAGARFGAASDPQIVSIDVTPARRTLAMRTRQPLQVTAKWSDGRVEDVTALATFQSNHEPLATVDEHGLVTTGESPGTAAVMASYLGQVDVFHLVVPRAEPLPGDTPWLAANFIDRRIHEQLRELNIAPAPRCDDATFLRRAYLDILGTLPTAEEARAFLAGGELPQAERRARLVDALLDRDEYADYWALQWADLLRVNRRVLGHRAAREYYDWIHDSFRDNTPLDQFARELLTAEGPLAERPAGHFYKSVSNPKEMASTLSQVFLGVRIECAQCHHHPWDRWGQEDYYGLQGLLTEVKFKASSRGIALFNAPPGVTRHPRTGEPVPPRPLDGEPLPDDYQGSRRAALAQWLTAPDNPWFARNLANRAWAHFLGRGLVEPVDDVRLTNPASHPELLDELAEELRRGGYDFKRLVRVITASEAYQRSSEVHPSNREDEQGSSRFPLKRLGAEVLLDAINQATGIGEKFPGHPPGVRAIALWDSHVPHYFLKLFGRPARESACQCERVVEPSVGQVLHVLNSPELHAKLAHAGGRVAQLVEKTADDSRVIEELYLTYFSRFPSEQEQQSLLAHLQQAPDRRLAAQDIAWSLMNSLEFLFNH